MRAKKLVFLPDYQSDFPDQQPFRQPRKLWALGRGVAATAYWDEPHVLVVARAAFCRAKLVSLYLTHKNAEADRVRNADGTGIRRRLRVWRLVGYCC